MYAYEQLTHGKKKKKCELSASFYGLRTKKYKHIKKNVWCFGCITNSAGVAQKKKGKKIKVKKIAHGS